MAANLTQKYRNAEKAWRRAVTAEEELQCLQIMFRELPRHKGTDKIQADLKQRISRLKQQLEKPTQTGKRGYRLPRQGAGRAVIIGGPNAGKSQLLASLTNAKPEVAAWPFSTREPQPGMMDWEDARVQLVDTPPITGELFDATTQALIRGAELVLLLLDLGDDDGGQKLNEVWQQILASKTRLGRETRIDENEIGLTWTRAFLVVNKIDLAEAADRLEFFRDYIQFDFETFQVSAMDGTGLEPLREAIYRAMNVVRVYTWSPSKKEPDMESPFLLPNGQTVLDLAELVHKDVARNFKSARVWGEQLHPGTQVTGDFVLADRNIVEIQTR